MLIMPSSLIPTETRLVRNAKSLCLLCVRKPQTLGTPGKRMQPELLTSLLLPLLTRLPVSPSPVAEPFGERITQAQPWEVLHCHQFICYHQVQIEKNLSSFILSTYNGSNFPVGFPKEGELVLKQVLLFPKL